jgi:hypothetical protein
MLFRETVAAYCENHTEHAGTVHTSQETHYVSATKINLLMLFSETVAVYCENYTEQTSEETHYVSATKPSRLMLFGETVAAYCENHTEHTDTFCGQKGTLNVKAFRAFRLWSSGFLRRADTVVSEFEVVCSEVRKGAGLFESTARGGM